MKSSGIPVIFLRLAAIALLALVFTSACVLESTKTGRLYSSPNYDDCVYFHEGSLLLDSVRREGFAGLHDFLAARGLHSPYSTTLAAAAFAVFGYHYMAPYAANVVVVVVYLGCLSWFFRRMPPVAWFAALVLFLSLPFITMGVVEFRPDIAWAVATGFGAVFIVTSDRLFRNPRHAAVAGLFMALALLIKPSTFVMTAIVYSGALASCVVMSFFEKRPAGDCDQFFRGCAVFLGVVIVMAGPYWAFFGGDAWQYFMENSFGANKEVWAYTGSARDFLLYYVCGLGYHSNVGPSGVLLSLVAAGAALLVFIFEPKTRLRLLVLLGLIGAALVINTLARMKSAFLGGGIYGVWLFSCAWAIAALYECGTGPKRAEMQARLSAAVQAVKETLNRLSKRTGKWGLALIAVALICTAAYQWPEYSNWKRDDSSSWNFRNAERFMNALLDAHLKNPPHGILFSQGGPIIMETTALWYPAHGLTGNIYSVIFYRNTDNFVDQYPKYDWVVLQEQGVMGAPLNMPAEAVLPQMLDIIRADPRYAVIGEFTSGNGKKVWVYARKTFQK